jgi:hypothetical protein
MNAIQGRGAGRIHGQPDRLRPGGAVPEAADSGTILVTLAPERRTHCRNTLFNITTPRDHAGRLHHRAVNAVAHDAPPATGARVIRRRRPAELLRLQRVDEPDIWPSAHAGAFRTAALKAAAAGTEVHRGRAIRAGRLTETAAMPSHVSAHQPAAATPLDGVTARIGRAGLLPRRWVDGRQRGVQGSVTLSFH